MPSPWPDPPPPPREASRWASGASFLFYFKPVSFWVEPAPLPQRQPACSFCSAPETLPPMTTSCKLRFDNFYKIIPDGWIGFEYIERERFGFIPQDTRVAPAPLCLFERSLESPPPFRHFSPTAAPKHWEPRVLPSAPWKKGVGWPAGCHRSGPLAAGALPAFSLPEVVGSKIN